jgi:hypothetical protein
VLSNLLGNKQDLGGSAMRTKNVMKRIASDTLFQLCVVTGLLVLLSGFWFDNLPEATSTSEETAHAYGLSEQLGKCQAGIESLTYFETRLETVASIGVSFDELIKQNLDGKTKGLIFALLTQIQTLNDLASVQVDKIESYCNAVGATIEATSSPQ